MEKISRQRFKLFIKTLLELDNLFLLYNQKKQNEDMKNGIDKLNSLIEKQNEIAKENLFKIDNKNNDNDNIINTKCLNCEKK